ncbi:hypothetical protein THAOC_10865 [Thalassiosira oceanica]|uniref:Uncharacterized protein n=1 Tax=Thalassiosira oceanica TaxID=159749 RepID=K0SNW2_THAOC|nr:hypothetical protein THAOC_10865 [Thalassiosira oceanica]|eukprot:EJK68008.1 hypothetical protein THAOC_10865 [Thalassiosira oceanica]
MVAKKKPLHAYHHGHSPVHQCTLPTPMGSGKTTWEPTYNSSFTAVLTYIFVQLKSGKACSWPQLAHIIKSSGYTMSSGFQPPDTPQIQQVYLAMDPSLAYTLAHSHLSAVTIPRGSGKTTWEPTSSPTPTATPRFHAEISGFQPPDTLATQQVYLAMDPLLAYTLAHSHLGFFFLSAPLAITSYHTNKTRLAEAPFGPAGDDNGPGSEPPPHDDMIASAMSRRSRRAAGGLRRPSESRAFLASRSTIYLDDACGSSRDRWTCDIDYSMTQGRTGDPKTMVGTSEIIGIGPSPSRRHRRIPSASP